MSKLSTPLIIVLAIAAVVGFGGWRGAAGKLSGVTTDLTTASNKLAEVTAKLAEQGAATETLRTQLSLQKTDVAGANEQISRLTAQLAGHTIRLKTLEAEVARRDGQIAALNRTNGQQQASTVALTDRIKELEAALETARQQITQANVRFETTRAMLNETEAGRAMLLAKLNDPSALRAQLQNVNASTTASRATAAAKLQLNADGNVLIIPPPASPETKPKAAVPIFSEPPTATNAPKIILTY